MLCFDRTEVSEGTDEGTDVKTSASKESDICHY